MKLSKHEAERRKSEGRSRTEELPDASLKAGTEGPSCLREALRRDSKQDTPVEDPAGRLRTGVRIPPPPRLNPLVRVVE